MTITYNSSNNSCTITSDILLGTNLDGELEVTYNGTTTTLTVPAASSFSFTPEDIGQTSVFSDGVYTLHFTATLASSTVKEDRGCGVVLAEYDCSDAMWEILASKDFDKVFAYEALKIGKQCSSCSCSNLETYYNILTASNDTNTCATCSCTV